MNRRKQQEISLENLKVNIQIEIADSVERFNTALKLYEMAENSRTLAEETLNIEEQRYVNGRSSSFSVLELQKKVFNANTRELSALVDLYKARDQISAVTGSILERYGFTGQNFNK
jgi:outer membrane protein TolC